MVLRTGDQIESLRPLILSLVVTCSYVHMYVRFDPGRLVQNYRCVIK
jgi:hypothetical protein